MNKKILLFLGMFLLLLGLAQASLNTSLVSHWTFDTDLTDDYNGDSDGTNNGVSVEGTNPKLGNGSAFFNTSNVYATFPLNITSLPISINFWVDTDSTSGNNYALGVDKGSLWPYSLYGFGSQVCMRVQGTAQCGAGSTWSGGYDMYTILIVNNSHSQIYVNGVDYVNNTNTQTFSSSYDEIILGTLSAGLVTDSFEGHIDEVSVWSKTLTESEITELYNGSSGVSSSYLLGTGGGSPPASTNPSVVINLTFDNSSNRLKDYSIYDHNFTNVSTATYSDDSTVCKWYGCMLLNDSSIVEYITTTAQFNYETDGFGWEAWVYHEQAPSGSVRPGYYNIRNSSGSYKGYSHEDNQGWAQSIFNSTNSENSEIFGYANPSDNGVWIHYAMVCDDTNTCTSYKDGSVFSVQTGSWNDYTDILGSTFDVGRARYGEAFDGYLDEFIFYNSSTGLNQTYFNNQYESKRLGTPPDLDLYVKNINYHLPYNWSHPNNTLIKGGVMQINFTIENYGVTNNSNDFAYIFVLEDSTLCSGTTQLNAGANITISCNWTTSTGIKKGYFAIDTNNNNTEDVETNNNQTVYIPFLDKPYFHFNLTEWDTVIVPYAQNTSNAVANDDYTWAGYGGCSAFNDAYDGDNVDPYGKYARTCAMSCLVNNYSGYGCSQAIEHLEGWSNRTVTSYDNVQNIHELIHVGIAFDIMFPNLTQEQATTWADRFEDICQQITNLPNTRPDLDDPDSIAGDNGQGFSSGFSGFCYSILGLDSNNPTLIQEYDQQYYGANLVDSWLTREERFIRSYKNDSNALYEEGHSYMAYALYHYLDNAYYHTRNGLFDYTPYQNAYNAMAREWITQTLDFTYNGDTIRNDNSRYQRFIQRGDSRSYNHPSDGSILNCAVMTLSGLISNESDVKKGILYIRNQSNAVGDCDIVDGFADMYLYGQLASEIGYDIPSSANGLISRLSHDQANDIVTLRTGYTYTNDTVIQIDGGEERMNGHSTASGYYLYALGEPFLDYQQVPYNDDTRAETWSNGISLQNDTQTVEGQSSFYNANCYSAELNQYYGMSDCPKPSFSVDYPNYRVLPVNVSGEVENVYADSEGQFLTTNVWRPYYNSQNITEYFVKIDDVLIKYTGVYGVTQGEGVYHNFLSLNPEFNYTDNGNNFTLQRTGTNKKLDVDLIYSNETLTLDENPTNVSACLEKGSCTGADTTNQTYRRSYLYANVTDVQFILAHHWYENTTNYTIVGVGDWDEGVSVNGKLVYFDTTGDGVIHAMNFSTDAKSLAINPNGTETYMVSGATYVNYFSTNLFNGTESSFLSTYNATVTNETTPPTITLISPLNASSVNVSDVVEIAVNVTDDTNVSTVYVNITFPNATTSTYTLSLAVGNKYNVSISAELLGTHYLLFYANDTYDNQATLNTEFTVVDTVSPTWSVEPSNDSFVNNTAYSAQYNATDNVAIDTFFLNDTSAFNINASGYLTSVTSTPGNYTFNVSVNDTSNNILSKSITIEITAYNDGLALVDFDSYELYTENNLTGVTYYVGQGLDLNNYYLLVRADNITSSSFTTDGITVTQLNTSLWKLNYTSDWEVSRAVIMKSLFYGSNAVGGNPRVTSSIGGIQSLATNDPRDAGKRGIYVAAIGYKPPTGSSGTSTYYDMTVTLTFNNTVGNNDVSSWSYGRSQTYEPTFSQSCSSSFQLPTGTTLNSASAADGSYNTVTSDETETDTSSDDYDNPTTATLLACSDKDAQDDMKASSMYGFLLSNGSVNFSASSSPNTRIDYAFTDFYINESIPLFTFAYNTTNDTIELEAGNYTVLAVLSPYFNMTTTFTVEYDTDLTVNLTGWYDAIVNITLTEAFSGDSAEDFNVTVNSTIYNAELTANGTSVTFPFLLNYLLSVNLTDASYIPINATYNITSTPYLIALTAYRSIELNVNFYDEETLLAVNNVTFDVLNEYFSNTFNTGAASNTYYLAPLTDGIYEIRYSAPDYTDRSYHFQIPLNDEDSVNITLYLIESDVAQLFLRTITDQGNNPLDTYYLEVQRPYPSTDNTSLIYRTVEIASIDSQGDAVFTAIPNTQQYRFRILDEDLQLTNTLSPSYLVDTSSTIIATASTNVMDDFNAATDTTSDLYYQNSTSSFVFDFTAPATVDQVCLEVVNNTGFSSSTQTVCTTSYTGTLAIIVDDDQNVTYTATGYVYPSTGVKIPVDSDAKDFAFRGSREVVRYIGAFLFVMVLILCATIGGFRNPVPAIALAIGATAAFGISFLGLFTFSTIMLGGLLIIGIIILLLTKESDS